MTQPMLIAFTPRAGDLNGVYLAPPGVTLTSSEIREYLRDADLSVWDEVSQKGRDRTGDEQLALIGVDVEALRHSPQDEQQLRSRLEQWHRELGRWVVAQSDWNEIPHQGMVYACPLLSEFLIGCNLPTVSLAAPRVEAATTRMHASSLDKGKEQWRLLASMVGVLIIIVVGFGLALGDDEYEWMRRYADKARKFFSSAPKHSLPPNGDSKTNRPTIVKEKGHNRPETLTSKKNLEDTFATALERWGIPKTISEEKAREELSTLAKSTGDSGTVTSELSNLMSLKRVKEVVEDANQPTAQFKHLAFLTHKSNDDLSGLIPDWVWVDQSPQNWLKFRQRLHRVIVEVIELSKIADKLPDTLTGYNKPTPVLNATRVFVDRVRDYPAFIKEESCLPFLTQNDLDWLEKIQELLGDDRFLAPLDEPIGDDRPLNKLLSVLGDAWQVGEVLRMKFTEEKGAVPFKIKNPAQQLDVDKCYNVYVGLMNKVKALSRNGVDATVE